MECPNSLVLSGAIGFSTHVPSNGFKATLEDGNVVKIRHRTAPSFRLDVKIPDAIANAWKDDALIVRGRVAKTSTDGVLSVVEGSIETDRMRLDCGTFPDFWIEVTPSLT
jgi:hypothetical protein